MLWFATQKAHPTNQPKKLTQTLEWRKEQFKPLPKQNPDYGPTWKDESRRRNTNLEAVISDSRGEMGFFMAWMSLETGSTAPQGRSELLNSSSNEGQLCFFFMDRKGGGNLNLDLTNLPRRFDGVGGLSAVESSKTKFRGGGALTLRIRSSASSMALRGAVQPLLESSGMASGAGGPRFLLVLSEDAKTENDDFLTTTDGCSLVLDEEEREIPAMDLSLSSFEEKLFPRFIPTDSKLELRESAELELAPNATDF